jgi:hypothetical protein
MERGQRVRTCRADGGEGGDGWKITTAFGALPNLPLQAGKLGVFLEDR